MIKVLTHPFDRRRERKTLSFVMPFDGRIKSVRGLFLTDTLTLKSTVRYHGTGAAGLSTSAGIEGLEVESTGHDTAFAVRIPTVNGEKIYYAHPKSLGIATLLLDGQLGQFNSPTVVSGVEQFYPSEISSEVDYYLWESIDVADGSEVLITAKKNI